MPKQTETKRDGELNPQNYNFKYFRIEIRNASATSSNSNQLRNVNTIRWEPRTITTQPREIDNRECEVIAFVVNAGVNITAKYFYIFK